MTGRSWWRWQLRALLWGQGVMAVSLLGVAFYQTQALRHAEHIAELHTARATCQVLAYIVSTANDEHVTPFFEEQGTVCRLRFASGRQVWWRWEESAWRLHEMSL